MNSTQNVWHVSFDYLNRNANTLFDSVVIAAPTAEEAVARLKASTRWLTVERILHVQPAAPGTAPDALTVRSRPGPRPRNAHRDATTGQFN